MGGDLDLSGVPPADAVEVPGFDALRRLRCEGMAVGYRGIHIYLRYRAILEVLAGMRFRRALGVGAGYGIFDRLLPAGLDYTGIDVDPDTVAFATAWAARNRPCFSYRALPLAACSFADGGFDLILLSEVVEHMPEADIPPLFREIDRILAPGGHLLLSVPNHLHLRNRARRLFARPTVLMDRTHLREYTLSAARALVADLPFRLERFRPAVLYFPLEPWVARVVPPQSGLRQAIIDRIPQIASHFIFLLRKERGPAA